MSVKQLKTATIVDRIARLGETQERFPPTSDMWHLASTELAPLFAEMARRQKANGNEGDWRQWTAA